MRATRTLEPSINKLNHRPVLRDLNNVLLLRRRNARKKLVDVRRAELAELSDGLDALLLRLSDDLGGEMRKLQKRGRRGVDGLEEELLEVHDRDVGREPVVGESDGSEAGTEGKGDGSGDVLLCERKKWISDESKTEKGERRTANKRRVGDRQPEHVRRDEDAGALLSRRPGRVVLPSLLAVNALADSRSKASVLVDGGLVERLAKLD
jgi:hypothetical protein